MFDLWYFVFLMLGMVATELPSPLEIGAERVERLLCPSGRRFDSLPSQTQQLKNGMCISDIPCRRVEKSLNIFCNLPAGNSVLT